MKRSWMLALVLGLAATPARAHFLFLLPDAPDGKGPAVRLVFSDAPAPDDPKLLDKVKHTELFEVGPDGKTTALKLAPGKDCFEAALTGKGERLVAGVCRYGVTQRGESEPFLLCYYPKTVAQAEPATEIWFRTCDKLALEIVPVKDRPAVRVLWQGKPVADAEVVLLVPGQEKPVEGKTDNNGEFALPPFPDKAGVYAFRARHVEKKEGEHDGKKYKEVRHYATLTFARPGPGGAGAAAAEAPARKADPAATKLLADARAARANWVDFPGFRADLLINLDGKVHKAAVTVNARGEVAVDSDDEEAVRWARRQLTSLAGHRLDDAAGAATPCAFADDNENHPLGRAVMVLNDEFHSGYRIRDRQVIVVNRTMGDSRFSIIVMENVVNAEKKFLPGTYAVNTWDLKTDALKRSDTYHHAWKRVGAFDLPAELTVVTATDGKMEARSLRLSNHELLKR
jgi:uncharacterized GH25 family protein